MTFAATEPTVELPDSLLDGMLAYWNFDQNWADIHNGYHGTPYGPLLAAGKVSNAGSFDGIDDLVSLGDVFDFEYTQPFSVAGWVYPDTFPGPAVDRTVIGRIKGAWRWNGWKVYQGLNQRLALILRDDTSGLLYYSSGERVWNAAWTHFVISYDGSGHTNGVSAWVDGVADTPNATTNTLVSTVKVPYNAVIGAHNEVGLSPFDGLIDELSIWDRVLTADEAAILYSNGGGRGYQQETPTTYANEVATTIKAGV